MKTKLSSLVAALVISACQYEAGASSRPSKETQKETEKDLLGDHVPAADLAKSINSVNKQQDSTKLETLQSKADNQTVSMPSFSKTPTSRTTGVSHFTDPFAIPPEYASKSMIVIIKFPNRNPAALEARLSSISDPKSPEYRRTLSDDEFCALWGISKAEVQTAADSMKAAGFEITTSDCTSLSVEGKPTAVEKAFTTTIKWCTHISYPVGSSLSRPSTSAGFCSSRELVPSLQLSLPSGSTVLGPPVVGQYAW